MASRGQEGDVSALGPVAIDFLAIMATALLLAGRRTVSKVAVQACGHAATVLPPFEDMPRLGVVEQDIPDEDIEALRRGMEGLAGRPAQWASPDSVPALDTNWTPQDTNWLARLGAELDSTTTPAAPVVTAELPVRRRQAVRGVVNEPEALKYAEIGRQHGFKAGEIAETLADHYGVSTRTIRRIAGWSEAVA
jgi:hypothetical protein